LGTRFRFIDSENWSKRTSIFQLGRILATLALFSLVYFPAILQLSDFRQLINHRKSRPYSMKNARTLAGTILYEINTIKFSSPSSLALSKNGRFYQVASLLKASLEVAFLQNAQLNPAVLSPVGF
jgi:hypothetical protein